jgi:hypothetical protein
MLASEHPGAVLGHDPLRPINGAAEEGRIYRRRTVVPDLEPPSPPSCSHRPKGQYPTATKHENKPRHREWTESTQGSRTFDVAVGSISMVMKRLR